MASEDEVRAALARIIDPATGQDVLAGGLVRSLKVDGDTASFVMEVAPESAASMEPLRAAAEAAVRSVNGIAAVRAVMTAPPRPIRCQISG